MRHQTFRLLACALFGATVGCGGGSGGGDADVPDNSSQLDEQLAADFRRVGLTGNIESTLEARLGRKIDAKLADLGRRLFFDTAGGLNDDNTCAGCHAPATDSAIRNRLPSACRTMDCRSSGPVHATSAAHRR